MPFPPGTRLGPYDISASIGAGGMGEVYRGRDATLNRDVAIKVLPTALAGDAERLARFKREAQVLASLNHSNIAHVYGFEAAGLPDGSTAHFLAMELVAGEDLSERLKRGAIPIDEAVAIAKQIAEGLEEAHEHGIIHRDLKPANIKVAPDGKVKVLDFGLAKALEGDPSSSASNPQMSHSPTMSRHMTEAGMIMGTAAYMSPEQARGKVVDKRADIWAFGVVLFEMLSGARLFAGETVSDTLAAVLKTDPDWSALPKDVPASLRQLLRRCLDRNPRNRLHDIADARIALDEIALGTGEVPLPAAGPAAAAPAPRRHVLPWTVAAVATAIAVALWVSGRGLQVEAPLVRFDLPWPGAAGGNDRTDYFELSPDGRSLAIVAQNQIWVRALDSQTARALAGTEGATYPFWSPDGASLGFFASGELRRIGLDGGRPQKLCDAQEGRGGAWGPSGTIVFSSNAGDRGLSRVEDRGGQPSELPKNPSTGVVSNHRYPQFLPDGRHFIFTYLSSSKDAAGIYVGDLDGTAPFRVLDGSDHALFAPAERAGEPGYLLFRRQETLMAVPFDPSGLRVAGEMFPVAERVGNSANTGHGAFAVSAHGILAHSEMSLETDALTWLDRSGRVQKTVSGRLAIDSFEASPDERTIAFSAEARTGRTDIWLQPSVGGSPSRLTFGEGQSGWSFVVWSSDNREMAYATQDLAGLESYEIRKRRVDRTGEEQALVKDLGELDPWDISPDGRQLVYSLARDQTLWVVPLQGEPKATAFATTAGPKRAAQYSPDGRFIAYGSGPAESSQVFVQPLPAGGALWQVSTQGGSMPRWRADGRELFYRGKNGELMAAAVRAANGSLEFGAPQALFTGLRLPNSAGQFTYQPSRDGQRFLVARIDETGRSAISVVLNWRKGVVR